MLTTINSRQIRPPIYSIKQSRLRKRRVIRYAMLYFLILIVFIVLVVGPVIVRKYIKGLPSIPMKLLQPTGQNNNDTMTGITGSALLNFGQDATAAGTDAAAAAATTSSDSNDPFSFGGGRFVRW